MLTIDLEDSYWFLDKPSTHSSPHLITNAPDLLIQILLIMSPHTGGANTHPNP